MNTIQSKDGTTLAYDVSGKGPALIYITGATCHRQFKPVQYDVEVYSSAFTVYNYDRRGRGDSSNTLPWSADREIEDIEALIDAAGGKAILFGHSSGAILALKTAMKLPGKVEKLVLYDAAYCADEAALEEFQSLGTWLYQQLDAGKNQEAITGFLEGIGIPAEAFDSLFPDWQVMVDLAPTLTYDTKLASELPPVAAAMKLQTPTCIMVGELSPESMHKVGNQLHKAIAHSVYIEVKGQDHMPSPEVVLPVLTGFLKPQHQQP
ncbi:alpha/beta hydrolase [Pseudoflavitalea sp. G-6-1-2]|uniref:alpha/beta fold hydrolase n=1 Tax=Pseudoflavitalea sp. G-6-1-2 TaxID=2728841 RepID=UPI00146D398D|nr:alpha/beta hydrolase [Pseudoflavitalea sp. G-6-1-2]NML21817.1 alpha/beta hydrolase [Pseudoflavitalea sp. G-6-1-2]